MSTPFAIQEINESIRLTRNGTPICEMLGTRHQKLEQATYLKSAANYKAEKRQARDDERIAREQARRWGMELPKHLDAGGGVHFIFRGKPEEGNVGINARDPNDSTWDFRGLPTISREEALAWIPFLRQPEILNEAYRALIKGEHLKGRGEVRHG